jgi:hypothetical protein
MKDLEKIVADVVEKEIIDTMKRIEELEKHRSLRLIGQTGPMSVLKKLDEVFQHGPEIPSSLENSEDSKNN